MQPSKSSLKRTVSGISFSDEDPPAKKHCHQHVNSEIADLACSIVSHQVQFIGFPLIEYLVEKQKVGMGNDELERILPLLEVHTRVLFSKLPNVFSSIHKSGAEYLGQFVNSVSEGIGQLKYSNGDVFIGKFEKGAINGPGIMTFKNGARYIGDFKRVTRFSVGILHGKGKLFCPDQTVMEGSFTPHYDFKATFHYFFFEGKLKYPIGSVEQGIYKIFENTLKSELIVLI